MGVERINHDKPWRSVIGADDNTGLVKKAGNRSREIGQEKQNGGVTAVSGGVLDRRRSRKRIWGRRRTSGRR